jgi:cytochrome P450
MISPLFSPARMRQLELDIREQAVRLIDGFAGQGRCEFVSAFACPLPSTVFLLLMGWPLEDSDQFNAWTHQIIAGRPGGTTEESSAVRASAMQAAFGYFDEVVADRRAHPGEDFTTQLVHGRFAGDRPLRPDELQRMLALLMLGGLHTVQGVLSSSVIRLATDPEKQATLRANPTLVPHAVEEMLRYEPPVWPARRALRDVEIGEVLIKEDDMVLCGVTAANHDASEFPDPSTIDFTRQENRHLTFSVGRHRCIGSHLARIELRIALEELHRRLPTFQLAPERPPVRHLGAVSGVNELHIRW